jgi:hypothetical protein
MIESKWRKKKSRPSAADLALGRCQQSFQRRGLGHHAALEITRFGFLWRLSGVHPVELNSAEVKK